MITYTIRTTGLTYEQNLAGDEALLTAFSKWKPEEGLSIQAFVSNLSGTGGYVLAEADDPKVVTSFVSKFNYWNDIDVVPVIDVSEAVSIGHSSLAWAHFVERLIALQGGERVRSPLTTPASTRQLRANVIARDQTSPRRSRRRRANPHAKARPQGW